VEFAPLNTLAQLMGDLEAQGQEPLLYFRFAALVDRSVVIEVDVRVDGEVLSRWLVECSNVVEHCFFLGEQEGLFVTQDHELLLDYVDRRAELYFTSASNDAAAVAGALEATHNRFMGDWRPMSRYVNRGRPLSHLLAESSGKLASGPASLIAAYDEVLESYGIKTTVLDAGVAKQWDSDRQWIDVEQDLYVVIFSGFDSSSPGPASFVIAPQFGVRPPPSTRVP
jgi:hypothetical protein